MTLLEPVFNLINKYVFSHILNFFMSLTGGSFALAILLFTLVINLLLIPLSIKSQKASVQQIKLKPKLDEIKRKCGDDKQKYQAATQKLYQEEQVSMGGGCLPLIVRLVLIMAVYYLVISPLTYLTPMSKDDITASKEYYAQTVSETQDKKYETVMKDIQLELKVIGMAKEESTPSGGLAAVRNGIKDIDFDLFGRVDLTKKPSFSLNFAKVSKDQLILWIIPFLSFAGAMFSGVISLIQQKKTNPGAPSMAGMLLTMPLLSLFIAFNAPAGLGFYWACSSFIGGLIQAGVQEFYGPYKMIAAEQVKTLKTAAVKEEKIKADQAE